MADVIVIGAGLAGLNCAGLLHAHGLDVEVVEASRSLKLDATRIQAFLPGSGAVRILWSPELEKLSGELVASCDSILVGSAKVGALQLHLAVPATQDSINGLLARRTCLRKIHVCGQAVM